MWQTIALMLDELDPPAGTGGKRIDQRKALSGIIHQLRTRCRWNAMLTEGNCHSAPDCEIEPIIVSSDLIAGPARDDDPRPCR